MMYASPLRQSKGRTTAAPPLLLVLLVASFAALLGSVPCTTAAQDDESSSGGGGGGGMPDFGQPKVCPPFRCTSGHSAAPKSRPKFESSGCSSMGTGLSMFSGGGGSGPDDPMESCCDRWHACYQICGASKKGCDDAFKKCGDEECGKIEDEEKRKKCESSASISVMMLGLGDCRKYDDAQRGACQCVMTSKVDGYRKDAIRGFYRKFAPNTMDDKKIDALAEKADNRAKMAGLFMKLLAKYPKAIKRVKDPQQAYMEEMMNKAKRDAEDDAKDEVDGDKVEEEGEEEGETQEL